MKLKHIFLFLAIGIITIEAAAQEKLLPLEIGNQVPDITFKMLNHSSASASLSDYKGKVIIIDFWATFCTSCIKKFPYLDSLQKENPDFVKIILVSRDNLSSDPDKLNRFMAKYIKKHPGFALPTAFNDSIATGYFPHTQVPQAVWINPEGRLVAVTNGQEIDKETIRKVYEGKPVNFRIKKDIMDFNVRMPLFSSGNGGEERNVKHKSIITGNIDGLGRSMYSDLNRKTGIVSTWFIRNFTLERLFKEVYGIDNSIRTVMDVKNADQYIIKDTDSNWGMDKRFSYEIITAPTSKERLHKLMKNDLYAYFGMTAKLEKRILKCFEIINSPLKASLRKKDSKRIVDEDDLKSLSTILQILNHGPVPAFDKTGITDDSLLIEIKYDDIKNPQLLKKLLNEHGLDIIETEKELEVFVISQEGGM